MADPEAPAAAPRRRAVALAPALAGVAASALTLGTSALLSAAIAPGASPLLALGGAFIDATPPWLKDAAVALFGTQDKLVLQIGMVVVVVALGALTGLLGARRRSLGAAVVVLLSAVVAAAALTREDAGLGVVVPSAAGALVGVVALVALLDRLPARDGKTLAGTARPLGRRDFLLLSGAAVVVGAVATVAGQALGSARAAIETIRASLRLPRPARPAQPLPDGVQVEFLEPFVTPNDVFYRIDTALTPPTVDPATWRLRVHGLVEREVEITFDELLASHLVEAWVTLACVSNAIGGDLVGNAKWLGLPVRELLARAGPLPGADMVLSRSADGFTASTPLEVLTDERDALLAVGMNDEPLPLTHGFPARLVVPGLYGYVSATKWVVDLEVTRFRDAVAYWTVRGWAPRAPIKTASRIDVPRDGGSVRAGTVMVGGTAWAQARGIEQVEVRVDEGPWAPAQLAAVPNVDTWRQWSYAWEASPGSHTLQVRASDPDGPQTQERRPPAPDGATGWHTITVTVAG